MAGYEDSESDAPLDPAAARLRRKLVSLLFVSGGIMMLGLIAVFGAIVYKLNERGARGFSADAPIEAGLTIPAGARIEATALDGERALLTLALPDGTTLLVLVDLASGRVIGRYSVIAE